MRQYNISFIGAGKVAGSLAEKLYSVGHQINKIVSLSPQKGKKVASSVKASWSNDYSFDEGTDVIIVSVSDNSLEKVLHSIKCDKNTFVVHTAGSYGLDVFPKKKVRKGVLYPVQSFSEGRKVDYKGLPFLLETKDDDTLEMMREIVASLEANWSMADVEHRRLFHVAAVFVNNFTNHMLYCGEKIAKEADIDFKLLEPLAKETIAKAFLNGPENSMTGPAVRKDYSTINLHKELLSFDSDLRKLYVEITEAILNK